MSNIEKFITEDGSIGLFDKDLNEIFHSRFGAKKEAFEKFIEPALFLKNQNLKILDICYGIGYNTKTALKFFKNIELIDCIEINSELVNKSYTFEFDENIDLIIQENIKNPQKIRFYIDDARKIITSFNKKYDLIFHDGFAPYKQPLLWSEDFINQITSCMHKNSFYCTYNHSKPILNALKKTGLTIGKTIKNDKIIGTVASFNSDLIKNKYNEMELGELNTKSAITYKDKDLKLTSSQIIKNRENEVKNSKLISLSQYKKRLKLSQE